MTNEHIKKTKIWNFLTLKQNLWPFWPKNWLFFGEESKTTQFDLKTKSMTNEDLKKTKIWNCFTLTPEFVTFLIKKMDFFYFNTTIFDLFDQKIAFFDINTKMFDLFALKLTFFRGKKKVKVCIDIDRCCWWWPTKTWALNTDW